LNIKYLNMIFREVGAVTLIPWSFNTIIFYEYGKILKVVTCEAALREKQLKKYYHLLQKIL